MPYILLIIGLIFAVIGLYRFFLRAEARQIKSLFLTIAALAVGFAALFLALTGRLPIAIAILTALWPITVSFIRNKKMGAAANNPADQSLPMTEKEAYEVLGLDEGASEEDIKSAHLRLMKKLHPDQEGSDWLAQKINTARDILIKQ